MTSTTPIHAATTKLHDLQQQCLRILHCTAKALVSSPGGLRFKAGTKPWLEGLAGGQPVRALPDAAAASVPQSLRSKKPRHRGFFTAPAHPGF